jgi:hypothetical protein
MSPGAPAARPPSVFQSVLGYIGLVERSAEAETCLRSFGIDRLVVGIGDADLADALSRLDEGDVLVVSSLDHLGQSTWRIFDLLDDLAGRGIAFVSLTEGIDTRDAAVAGALRAMRSMLDAERRLVARRSSEARAAPGDPVPRTPDRRDVLLERSRLVAAPWIDDVRENRPRLTWEQLVERVERSGRDTGPLSASLMRRHVRRLVAAGDLPESVLDRAQRGQDGASVRAAERVREMLKENPSLSLRRVAMALEMEGFTPPRADSWSAQTVKRLTR